MGCAFELSSDQQCGLEVSDAANQRCKFHSGMKDGHFGEDISRLADYITHFNGKVVPLQKITFRNRRFDKAVLGDCPTIDFKDSTFVNCVFHACRLRNADFTGCTFEDTLFWVTFFSGDNIRFLGSSFSNTKQTFESCDMRVDADIDFGGTSFRSDAQPFQATFMASREVKFTDCILDVPRLYVKVADSSDSHYDHRYLTVHSAKFVLRGIKLAGHLEIAGEHIPTEDKIRGSNDKGALVDQATAMDFSHVNFGQMKSATFKSTNLAKATFEYANIAPIDFVDPYWPDRGDRRILWDDLRSDDEQKEKLDELRRQYAQLKRNYATNQDFIRSGQWYYRETECRRRVYAISPGKRKFGHYHVLFVRAIFSLYRFISEYGENAIRPFWGLIVLCLAFTPFYMWAGFEVGGVVVKYQWTGQFGNFWETIADWIRSLVFSLGAMSLQVGRTLKPVGIVSTGLAISQLIFTAVLLPLFLLAVRRKFKA